jgi:hypothetical protein
MLAYVVERRLVARLRYQQGVSYSPAANYQPLDADHALVSALAAAVEGQQPVVAETVLSILGELADEGCTDDELADYRLGRSRQFDDPGARRGWLYTRAWDSLVGARQLTYEQLTAQVQALTSADIAAKAAEARDDALYLLPPNADVPETLVAAPAWSDRGLVGTAFREKRPSAGTTSDQLDIAEDGVTVRVSSTQRVTVWFDHCAAMLAWPDGRRTLFGTDAFVLPLNPGRFVGGDRIPQLLDERVPPELVVPMPAGDAPRVRTFGEPRRQWALFGALFAGTVASAAGAVAGVPALFAAVVGLGFLTVGSASSLRADRRARGLGRPFARRG